MPDDGTDFDRIPTWMWALVFILVAVLLLTYAGLLLSQLTASSARKRVKGKLKSVERRAPSPWRSSTGSDSSSPSPPPATTAPFIRRHPGVQSPIFDSGTVNSHLVAVCPGYFMRDQACQTDGAVVAAGSARDRDVDGPTHVPLPQGQDADRQAQPDDGQSSLGSSLSIDTPGTMTFKSGNMKSTGISTQSFNSSFTLESDRDLVSHLTATGLYGKAGEPLEASLPRRSPNVPGFRIVEQPRNKFPSFRHPGRPILGTRPSQNRYRYSITEEDGFLFHEIHFPGMVPGRSGRPTPPVIVSPRLASESEGGSVFTGASYSDVFGDVEPRTANVPDGASNAGEPHGIPLPPVFRWDYTPPRWGMGSQRGSGERRQRKKVIEIEC